MIDPLLALAHSLFSSKGVFAVLLGSGISRGAGVPTGWEITLDLIRRLAAPENADPGIDPEAWYVSKFGKAPRYSELLNALAKTRAERRSLLHSYFEPSEQEQEQGLKRPSAAHRAIADLVTGGHIKLIVTTNFDKLMEIALRDVGIEPTVISTPDTAEGAAPLVHQRCVVLKINGDYLDDRIRNTEDELASYDKRMTKYLDRVLDEFGMIVCGWSAEWDIGLRAAIERCSSRRYSWYWAQRGNLTGKAAEVIANRQAVTISIADANSFFSRIREMVVSLTELQPSAPLSVAAAVATVKRYVSEPRFDIQLHDFLVDELSASNTAAIEALPIDGVQPNAQEFSRRVKACDARLEIGRNIVFQAAQWIRPATRRFLLRGMQRLGPHVSQNGLTAWLDLRLYPALIMTYAAALGALLREEFALFQEVATAKYRYDSHDFLGIETLIGCIRHAGDLPQALIGGNERRFTPMNDHLANLFEPMLGSISADPEFTFDAGEVLMVLAWLDARYDELPVGTVWIPVGRFAWKWRRGDRAPSAVILAQAKARQGSWAPVKAGMFGGDPVRMNAICTLFENSLAEIARRMW